MRLLILPFLFISSICLAVEPTGYTEDEFIYAAERCNLNALKSMLTQGHDVNAPGLRTRTTALINSHLCGFEQISFLIENGANVNATDSRGNTLLHNLAQQCARVPIRDIPKIFDLLAAKQMNFSPKGTIETPVLIATRCATGNALLNGVKILNQLVKNGADVNGQDSYRTTAMHIAAEKLNDEAMRILFTGKPNLEVMNAYGLTPLGVASKDMESVLASLRTNTTPRFFTRFELLINAGANIDVEDGNGTTPLYHALQEPIRFAAERATVGIDTLHKLRHLILLKANVLKVDKTGNNLLHGVIKFASYPNNSNEQAKRENNALAVIRLLRSEGVDPNQKNRDGESAIDVSARLRLNLINQALRCTAC